MRNIMLLLIGALLALMFLVACDGSSGSQPDPDPQQPSLTDYVDGLVPYNFNGRISFLRLELTATSRKTGESFGCKVFCKPVGKQETEITTVTVDGAVRKPLVKIEASLEGRPLSKAGYSTYAYVVPVDGTAQNGDKILVSAEVDARDMALFLAEVNGWPVDGEPTPQTAKDDDGSDLEVIGWILSGIGIVGALLCPTEYGEVVVTGGGGTTPPPTQRILDRVTVSPSSAEVAVGHSWQFTATGYDQFSQVIAGLVFTWEISASLPSGSSITQNGMLTIGNDGSGSFSHAVKATATYVSTQSGYANVTVPEPAPPDPYAGATLFVTPQDPFLDPYVGDEQQFERRIFAANGLTELAVPAGAVTVWSSNPDGFIDQAGYCYSVMALGDDDLVVDSATITCTVSWLGHQLVDTTTVSFVPQG